MKNIKENLELIIIPGIMLIISVFIAFSTEEKVRKILLVIVSFLLGMQVQKCLTIIQKHKK